MTFNEWWLQVKSIELRMMGFEIKSQVYDFIYVNCKEAWNAAPDTKELLKDKARLDWLADVNNKIGNVQLPRECTLDNLHDMRAAIDAAMELEQ